jgi:hypothetical protein
MNIRFNPTAPLLVASSEPWGVLLRHLLTYLQVDSIHTTNHAATIAQLVHVPLSGVLFPWTWARFDPETQLPGILDLAFPIVPTVTFFSNVRDSKAIESVWHPPHHRYCPLPFDTEEVLACIRATGMANHDAVHRL